ncbi:E3 ubiquitin-protein ligase TRIM45 isoform X5 [Camelus bactrianus]|uniref:E3 ubiquitin-protein ligase TRIM45 isoform X5 n=1 Tax=Camelus bactrianus TaxID=9837 RepID=A0AC58QVR7_CAMBA
MPLTPGLTLFLFRGPSPQAAPPWRGQEKMWNFQSLLDAGGVALGGRRARSGEHRPSRTNCPGPFLILSTNVGNMAENRKPLLGFVGKLPSGTTLGNSGKTHCPLCMGLFKAPRLLPCLHTVCTTCLEQLEPFSVVDIRGGESDTSSEGSLFQELKPRTLQPQIGILCPVCDAQVDLPMGGVKALTIDHLAMNDVMLESLRGEGQGLVCDLCSDREVEKRCQTCKANLCHFCCQAHRRQKKTTYHTMVDLKDLKGCSRIGKPILCPAHPAEELRLFCELCDRPVCRDCVVGEHREHPCDFTSNVIHKHGDSVRELLKGTQPHVQALEEALAQIKGTNSALQARVEAVANDVRSFSEGYIKAIEEHRDKLLQQLEDIRVQKENSLQLQKAQLEQLLEDMRTGVEFTEHLLTSGSDLEILITKGVVVERLTKLNKVEYSAHPGVTEKIAFSPKEKAGLCRGYEVYGAISTKEVDPAKCVLQGEGLAIHRDREEKAPLTPRRVSLLHVLLQRRPEDCSLRVRRHHARWVPRLWPRTQRPSGSSPLVLLWEVYGEV